MKVLHTLNSVSSFYCSSFSKAAFLFLVHFSWLAFISFQLVCVSFVVAGYSDSIHYAHGFARHPKKIGQVHSGKKQAGLYGANLTHMFLKNMFA